MPVVHKQDNSAPQPKTDVLSRIKPIGFGADEGLKALVYGRSGTGKTTFWSTFPKPILSVVVSGGNKPGELRSIDTIENRKVISSVPLDHSDELMDLINYAPGAGFRTIVLDHVSGFQDKVLSQIIGKHVPEQKSWGLASQQQYGQCTLQCKEMLRDLLSLPINVVLVGQERTFGGEESNDAIAPSVGCALMPQLGAWLNCAVDYIVNTFIRNKTEQKQIGVGTQKVTQTVTLKEVEYCLRTGPDATYTTKFRVPKGHKLPDVMVDPDYTKMLALIRGNTTAIVAKPGIKPGQR